MERLLCWVKKLASQKPLLSHCRQLKKKKKLLKVSDLPGEFVFAVGADRCAVAGNWRV
jgi:tRNA A37 threonylcarbamoyladenosine synthetase subunit TsaC/SUA5/YrdC